jgi:hypothetical protein
MIHNTLDTPQEALRTLCGSDSRVRLFKALYGAVDKEYHLRGLAAAASIDPSHVHKLLSQMVDAGLCEQVQTTSHPKYRARKDHPLFGRLKDLFQDAQPQVEELGDVDLQDTPVLRSLLWTGKQRSHIPAREAFEHYERNWRFVRRTALRPKERKLIDRLAKAYGGGLING